MNVSWTTWMLAGALAASLAWNLRGAEARPVTSAPSCELLDVKALGLSEEQSAQLDRWKQTSCARSCRTSAGASGKLAELHAALRDASASKERLHELAGEVSAMRAQSLVECVDSVVEVRKILTPAQLELLLERCCAEGGCER